VSQERRNILIVDDDESLCSILTDRLRAEGYDVDVAGDGIQGVIKSRRRTYDLIILDQMLPERSGWDVCRDIRQDGITTPIMFLTALRHAADKVTGLRLGADDYVTKPFCTAELMARIETQLRRAPARKPRGIHQFGPFEVDLGRAQVTRDGEPVHLARREFQLLRYLIERSDSNVSRAELLQAVWGYATTTTRTLDVHISSLREKLESNPRHPELILTVGGLGYKAVGHRNGKGLKFS
jgi:DNA-binding response OmpR family regulator